MGSDPSREGTRGGELLGNSSVRITPGALGLGARLRGLRLRRDQRALRSNRRGPGSRRALSVAAQGASSADPRGALVGSVDRHSANLGDHKSASGSAGGCLRSRDDLESPTAGGRAGCHLGGGLSTRCPPSAGRGAIGALPRASVERSHLALAGRWWAGVLTRGSGRAYGANGEGRDGCRRDPQNR